MSDDKSRSAEKTDKADRATVDIKRPASAETESYAGNLPTDTPVQKQGPNSFDAEEAKEWRKTNSPS